MNIISKYSKTNTIITGRLSDGSDRQENTATVWIVKVDNGSSLCLMSFDHDPTDTEIEVKLIAGDYQDITDNEYRLQQQIDTLALELLTLKGV